MTWPTSSPAVQPTTHDQVAAQAYSGVGGDYFRSGFYYSGGFGYSNGTTTAGAFLDTLLVRPFWLPVRRSFDRIAVTVSTGVASAVLRFGVYNHSAGMPSSLLVDGGTAAADTTGIKQVTVALTLNPGLYWLAVVGQVAQPTINTVSGPITPWWGQGTTLGSPSSAFPTMTVSGALPATFVQSNTVNTFPALYLRAL